VATITIADNQITVKLSRRNIEQLTDPYTPPEYSLWKKVTVNGEDVILNIKVESDDVHYNPEGVLDESE
jgi:hypothetical protein